MGWFAGAGMESVCVMDIPNNYDSKTNRGFYGERKIEMYELKPRPVARATPCNKRLAAASRRTPLPSSGP